MKKLIQALSFATIAHKYQRRKGANGSPFINHPIRPAYPRNSRFLILRKMMNLMNNIWWWHRNFSQYRGRK